MHRLIFLLTLLFTSCMASQTDESKMIRAVNSQSDQIAAKLDLQPFSFGTEGPGIKGLIFQFQTTQKVDIDQARSILIQLAEQLKQSIRAVNPDWNLDDPNFLYISIGFNDQSGNYNTEPGYIAHATISKYGVDLETYDIATKRFVPVITEPYAEAYHKVFKF